MVLVEKFKNLSKEKKIAFSVFLGIVIIAFIAFIVMMGRSGYLATTMRLLRVEGTVTIEDSKGGVKPVIDNIRFQSGDALSTGADGLASVGLDDTKVITLQSDSRAEFSKKSKQIELKYTKGGLYFEVTEHLDEDETYEIKTSNMTVGIRGTSGYVYYDESGLESIVVTDGVVKITATNPQTGEVKTIEIHGGQQAKVFLYSNRAAGEDSVMFTVKDINEEDLDEFPLSMIVENKDLMARICEYNNWDEAKLLSLYNGIKNVIENGEQVELSPTPTPTQTPTPSPSVSGSPAPTNTNTPTPTPEPDGDDDDDDDDDDDGGPTNTPTATPTATPTTKPSGSPSATPTNTATPSPSPVPKYTVTFNSNGHGTAPSSQTVEKGSTASKPEDPSADGYSFEGWYTEAACTTEYNFSKAVTSDITLYAKWEELPDPAPDVMEGATALSSAWGVGEDGDVYICYVKGRHYTYYGYLDGSWVELVLDAETEDSNGNPYGPITFTVSDTEEYYYDDTFAEGEVLEYDPTNSSEQDNPIVNDYPTTT